jgi:hypothetical protein
MSDARDEPAEKQFHGWRLLAVIAGVIAVLALVSAIIDWIVIV